MFTSLVEEVNLGYTGPTGYRLSAAVCLAIWAVQLRRRLRRCLLSFGRGRGCPSTARATVAPCAGPPHPQLLLPTGRTRGHTRRRTPREWWSCSWMVLSSLS
jgi:hypothetical protein